MAPGRDVVDDRRAGFDRRARRPTAFVVSMLTGTAGVGGQRPDHRDDPGGLVVGGDRRGAGPGGLATHVEHRGTRVAQREPVGDRGVGIEVAAPVGEGIRGHVDDPHDPPATAPQSNIRSRSVQGEPAAANRPSRGDFRDAR